MSSLKKKYIFTFMEVYKIFSEIMKIKLINTELNC